MPTVPLYNQGATEEAGLTRAKRRVIKAMNSGIAKLTEKPDEDPTGGSADQIATNLISQFEDLTALCRQVNAFLGDGEEWIELDTPDDAIKALRLVIIAAKATARILRTARALAPVMRFLDLGVLGDLKAAQAECDEAMFNARRAMLSIDFSKFERVIDEIGNYEDPETESFISEWDDMSSVGDESLGTKRTGSTSSKTGKSGSTVSKGSPPGSKLGVGPKQGRVNTMFRYMFGAAEDLRDAGVSMSLDRPPPGGKGKPRPRGLFRGERVPTQEAIRVPTQEDVDEDMTQSVLRGQRMAQLEEEEFQMREEGRALLQREVQRDAEQQRADEVLVDALNEERLQTIKPFKRFGIEAYHELIRLMLQAFSQALVILNAGYNNFNAYRQQKVLPAGAADADVANAVKTGSGMRGGFDMVQGSVSRMGSKVYKVGGSSDILYEREGLPRFL